MQLKESTRRRIAAVTAGLLLLLLISCNLGRMMNRGSIGTGATTTATTAPPPGTAPLPAGAPPGSAPAAAVPQQVSTPAAPIAAASAGAPVAPAVEPVTASTSAASSGLTSGAPPVPALDPPSAATQPSGGARPSAFSTIRGNVLRAAGTTLPGATVRLRDARFGRILETQLSDGSGVYAFHPVDPGVYVVEVVGDDQRVLAASQLLSVNVGDTVSTSVRLPERDFTGRNAAIVAAAAAAAGVLTTSATAPVSPTQ